MKAWCMHRVHVGVVLLALLLTGCTAGETDALHISGQQQVAGNIATVSRNIEVAGQVQGDVTSLTGTIHISGHVSGDVVSYGGGVVLENGARVDGSVLALSGGTQQQGAQVAGQVMSGATPGSGVALSMLDVSERPLSAPTEWLRYALLMIGLVLLSITISVTSGLVWYRRTTGASAALLLVPWRALVVGLLTSLLLGVLLLLSGGLLALSLLGLPLVLVLLLLAQLPYLYGLVIVAYSLSHKLMGTVPRETAVTAATLLVLALLVPVVLVGIVSPLGAALLLYGTASAGIGAVLLSRGGALVALRGAAR